ncbi:MAG: hypothetical protein HC810_01055 [Acaryochloridaceae cyanobacterium RL_2_7]|nr:hypothetical protein [Acaryochloridaceae cyanobacterium RL_2_7]
MVTAQLLNQSRQTFPHQPLSAESQAIFASIQSLVQAQLTLEEAVEVLIALPNLNLWERAIALSIYLWDCTPHNISIAIARAQRAWKSLQTIAPAQGHELQFLRPLTGF